jgi:hypothetical protein
MFRKLVNRFRSAPPPPRRAALPAPEVPVIALVPVENHRQYAPPLSPADMALADESNATIESDLEQVFALMRSRQDSILNRASRDGQYLIVLGLVEKFLYDNFDFGPEITHHIPAKTAYQAFESWLRATGRHHIHKTPFLRAATTVVEWQGGHRSLIDGQEVLVGCRLTPKFFELLNAPKPRFATAKDGKVRLGMGLEQLAGGGRN